MSGNTLLFTVMPVICILLALWRASPQGFPMRATAMVVTTIILGRLAGGALDSAVNLALFAGVVIVAIYNSGLLHEA
jgi:hypothetical protein